jgi:hypothetical protein
MNTTGWLAAVGCLTLCLLRDAIEVCVGWLCVCMGGVLEPQQHTPLSYTSMMPFRVLANPCKPYVSLLPSAIQTPAAYHCTDKPYDSVLAVGCGVRYRRAAEEAEFQARLELIKAEAAQKRAAGVSMQTVAAMAAVLGRHCSGSSFGPGNQQ